MVLKDYYGVLGIERTATPADIKRAYRKLARAHHPDLSKASDATEQMVALNEAHAVLSDPVQRAAYDVSRDHPSTHPHDDGAPRTSGWASDFDFSDLLNGGDSAADHSDLFEQLFARRATAGKRHRPAEPQRGADQHANIELEIKEAYVGTERILSVRSTHMEPSGKLAVGTDELHVKVPKGVMEGQHIRLAGRGMPGSHGGAPGDLLLQVHFKPDLQWQAMGRDIHGHLKISPWEAMLGGTALVHAFGADAELTLPAGWKQGRTLRLKGRGIPGKTPGDLYLELHVALPPADSVAAKEAYESMARAFPHFAPREGEPVEHP